MRTGAAPCNDSTAAGVGASSWPEAGEEKGLYWRLAVVAAPELRWPCMDWAETTSGLDLVGEQMAVLGML